MLIKAHFGAEVVWLMQGVNAQIITQLLNDSYERKTL